MAKPLVTVLGPLAAASANNIALSQTPGAAGNLTLNGSTVASGVATLDVARRVLITTAADESAKTLTVTGTDRLGIVISETLTGPVTSTGATQQDFKTITRVAVSAAFTGAVTIGTNGVASSPWQVLNYHGQSPVSYQVDVGGTANYTVEETANDLFNLGRNNNPAIPNVFAATANLTAKTAGAQDVSTFLPVGARITLNSGGTGTAFVRLTVIQAGLAGT